MEIFSLKIHTTPIELTCDWLEEKNRSDKDKVFSEGREKVAKFSNYKVNVEVEVRGFVSFSWPNLYF